MESAKRQSGSRRSLAEIAAELVQRDGDKATCRIDPSSDCVYIQAKYDIGNFIRHFRARHTEVAKERGLITDQDTPVKKARVVTKRLVAIDKQLFIDSTIKLITYHDLPLSCFEWEGLRQLIDPLALAVGAKVIRANARGHFKAAAMKIREMIADELKHRLICLKIDSASRFNRHILGINVQYAIGDKVVIRTLGMVEVKERQTAAFLKAKILELLHSYGVGIEQIFSVTCDNGANMIAAVKQLKTEFEHSMLRNMLEDNDEDQDKAEIELMDKLTNEFQDHPKDNLNMIRCVLHSLQLAILDVAKKSNSTVKEIKDVAKKCKSVENKTNFDYHNAKYTPVWCQTRWGGIYKMMEAFRDQKPFFTQLAQEFPELDLGQNWEFVEHYEQAFKPLFISTATLQAKHVSLGDFYMEWLITIHEVKKLDPNPFANALSESLSRRLENLRTSMAFKMALYLDPRFNFANSTVFTGDEKEQIQRFIKQTWNRIRGLIPQQIDGCLSPVILSNDDEKDDFITQMFGGTLANSDESSSSFMQQLKGLDIEKRQIRHITYGSIGWNGKNRIQSCMLLLQLLFREPGVRRTCL